MLPSYIHLYIFKIQHQVVDNEQSKRDISLNANPLDVHQKELTMKIIFHK